MNSPLEGRRILVTRRGEQARALADRLKALGASVVEIPTIEVTPPEDTRPLDQALTSREGYDWVVFTSTNAVRSVRERLTALGIGGFPGRARVAVVGPATAQCYRELFPEGGVPLQPVSDFRAEGLLTALAVEGLSGRVLLPTSDRARDALPLGLRRQGASPVVIVAYHTRTPQNLAQDLSKELETVDIAIFASPSAVEGFVRAAKDSKGFPAAVLGPVTEAAAREAGFDVKLVASPSTLEGLLQGLLHHFAARPMADFKK
jgi:uroporphyrinogen-III synthase